MEEHAAAVHAARARSDAAAARADRRTHRQGEAARVAAAARAPRRSRWPPTAQRIDEINDRLQEVDARLYRTNQEAQFAKATYDVDRYAFEAERKANPEGVGEQQKEIEAEAQRLSELNLEVEKVDGRARRGCRPSSGNTPSEVGRLQKEIDQLNFEQTRLQRVLTNIEPSFVKDYFRNAPLLDFMAPTLTVRQIVTPNVVDDVNFARVAKMDRCTTCHLAIDRTRLREVSAAVQDAPEPVGVCRQRLAASDGDDGLHGVPSGARRFDELQRCVALSGQ